MNTFTKKTVTMNNWEMFEKNLTEQAIEIGLNPEEFHWELISAGYENGNIDPKSWLSFYKEMEN